MSRMFDNEIGDTILLKLTSGLYFVVVWLNVKLSNDIHKIKVSESGRSVIIRKKKPVEKNAMSFLRSLGYEFSKKHIVTAKLQEELDRLNDKKTEEWDEDVLIDLKEEVLRDFVTEDGKPTNQIAFSLDKEERTRVAFFLQSVSNHSATPSKFTLARGGSYDSEFDEESVNETDELKDEIKGMARSLAEAMAEENKRARHNFRYDMQDMMRELVNVLQSPPKQHQQAAPHGATYPDQHMSS